MKKLLTIFPALFIAMLLIVGVASAHVTISPNQVPGDSYQKFTVKVPNEENVPVTKVKLVIPAKVDISSFEAVTGWSFDVQKDSTGKITSVTWTAAGNGLPAEQFIEFNMLGKVSKDAKQLKWKAYQTYHDGNIVKWIGPEGSDHPASVTTVVAPANDQAKVADQTNVTNSTQTSQWPLYLSVIAIVLGVISIITSVINRKKG